ncbi:MAG: helix-hairpin-helix domain-containing protein, partial [Planctomycetes bacterium]|nr:helix-hairpin-helix domain-containing protein [Planctomycetota bacterium]
MSEKVLKNLAGKHHLDVDQIQELLQLLDAGYSAPYILRYRKDLAANLDYEVLDELRREARRLNRLDKERQKIQEKLQDQGVLTGELEKDIESASSMSELIDYYVPFRPRKRSRSRLALSQGLEALALKIFHQEDPIPLLSDEAESYADEAQGLEEVGEVLDGTFHIICDWIAEEKSHRDKQRRVLREKGKVVSEGTGRSKKRYRSELRDYIKFESPVKDVHPYHILCMMRGKRLKVLDYRVEAPMEEVFQTAADLYLRGGREQFSQIETRFYDVDEKPDGKALGELNAAEFLYWCIRVSLSNVLIPILNRELEKELRAEAEKLGLDIIKSNLRSHLMRRPLKGARVLGISPGYRTGCKLAAVDENGGVLESAVVYPNTPRDEKEKAKEKIVELVQGHDLSVVSIGDGTACDETEKLLSEIIEESFDDLQYCVLDERPSDAYAGSSLAKRECGSRKKGIQSAISLARRLLDPLRELCKVNLKDLCPSRYVQEVDNIALKETIRSVAEESVGQVGPQLNEAPRGMLKYVPGLHGRAANEIVKYRNDNGPFDTRRRLREVPKIDKETWERAAGFVRIKDSDNPLDNTRIHPQMYPVAEKIVAELDCKLEDLKNEETLEKIREKRGEIKFADLEKEFDVHYLVLKDILDELCDPWPDPRQNEEGPVLRQKP